MNEKARKTGERWDVGLSVATLAFTLGIAVAADTAYQSQVIALGLADHLRDQEAKARDDAVGDLDRTAGDRVANDRQRAADEGVLAASGRAEAADSRVRAIISRHYEPAAFARPDGGGVIVFSSLQLGSPPAASRRTRQRFPRFLPGWPNGALTPCP